MNATTEKTMAKKKPTPAEGEPVHPSDPSQVTTTKVRKALLRQARDVAVHRGIDLFVYLDELLTPIVGADYKAVVIEKYKQLGDK